MVTFSYSTCCHLGVELHKSKSQRMENSEARLRKSERLGLQPTLQMGIWGCGLVSLCCRNMPVLTGLVTAPFLSSLCYTRTVSCLELAGLSFTYLRIRKPDWKSGLCLRHAAVMVEGSETSYPIAFNTYTPRVFSYPLPIHHAERVHQGGTARMEMWNVHLWRESGKWYNSRVS